jgi:hypothetical protein
VQAVARFELNNELICFVRQVSMGQGQERLKEKNRENRNNRQALALISV